MMIFTKLEYNVKHLQMLCKIMTPISDDFRGIICSWFVLPGVFVNFVVSQYG